MPGRTQTCNRCKMQLFAPKGAQSVRCSRCQLDMRISPADPFEQAHESIFQTKTKTRQLLHTTSHDFNMVRSSVKSYVNTTTSSFGYYPRPLQPRPLAWNGLTEKRKRAVLCGVSYYGSPFKLNGCVNDIRCMKRFLVENMGFPDDCIYVLTEEESDPSRIPTKHNIMKAMKWLVQDCQPRDSLIFHFSGHGSQQRDVESDEMDGYDETLLPVDHRTAGAIVDDEINEIIVRPLPHGAKLHAIIDACHSGTVLDLPFLCRMNREGHYTWEDHRSSTYKGTNGGIAISFTACDDHQSSVDTTVFTRDAIGPLTFGFIQAFQTKSERTYGSLLNSMRKKVHKDQQVEGRSTPFASCWSREPQLSSSTRFDVYSEPFIL